LKVTAVNTWLCKWKKTKQKQQKKTKQIIARNYSQ